MKQLGQYFTVSDELQQFVFDKVKNKGGVLLEPSFGAGHLLQKFKEYDRNYPIVCYEIDSGIKPVVEFNEHQKTEYADFTKQKITTKFKSIVGNPPYVKQKTGNLYIKFIELCYEYLNDDCGELIFIVPSDFIKLTSASSIISTMAANGSFTDFLFPHNEKLFEGATIDVMVFRYQKGLITNKTCVNDIYFSKGIVLPSAEQTASQSGRLEQPKVAQTASQLFININKGIITFSDSEVIGTLLESLFSVYVGLVSGRDLIYKVPFGNMDVLTDKNKIEKFIFTETFPTSNEQINTHLENNKEELLERRIKKFTEKNWFEWGAPRNLASIKIHAGKECIYVRNMTRKKEVAFVGTVQYFGGSLLCLVPKNTQTDLNKVVEYLNSPQFQKNYLYAGRFKIGHKQISHSLLDILII